MQHAAMHGVTAPARRRGHITVRGGPIALRFNARVWLMTAVTLVALLALATWAMTLGSLPIPFGNVVKAVLGNGLPQEEFIVRDLRLPRVLSAIFVGAALAMSGAIFQGLVRNPLVSPDIIGINTGATLFAVFWIVNERNPSALPLVAMAGALFAAGLIYLLAWKGGIAGGRLVLVGIGLNALFAGGTTYLMVFSSIERAASAQQWMSGSLYGVDGGDVRVLVFGLIALAPIAVALTWMLRIVQLGDIAARSVGLPLERTRLALIAAGCGLAALSVAVAGPVAFVALMTPHIARMLAGPLSSGVMMFTALIGAVIVLAADTVGLHFLPVTLPVGVVTAAIGAPYFLFLLYRSNARM